jgi:hypothetical protein
VNLDALVTATEAASVMPSVSKHLIGMWVANGKLEAKGRRGRSPLYRWGDVLAVEATMRNSPYSRRGATHDRKATRQSGELAEAR